MNMFKTSALAFAVLTALSGAALAQSADTGASGSLHVHGLSGRSLAGSGAGLGLNLPPVAGELALGGSTASGAALGWQPLESFRLELEYADRGTDVAVAPTGIDPNLASRSLMANALVDLKVNDWLTPYVGVGVGLTRLQADGFAANLQAVDSKAEAFSYQGIVGLSVPFSDQLSFFADGRYLRTGDFSLTPTSPTDHSLQSWSALAGLRFTFGK